MVPRVTATAGMVGPYWITGYPAISPETPDLSEPASHSMVFWNPDSHESMSHKGDVWQVKVGRVLGLLEQ